MKNLIVSIICVFFISLIILSCDDDSYKSYNKSDINKENNGDESKNSIPAYNQIIKNGFYKIIARHSSKCMEVQSASKDAGAYITQNSPQIKADNQIWLVQFDPDDNTYLLIAKNSYKCLDIESASLKDGAKTIQANWNQDKSQKWIISSVETEYFTINSKLSSKYLEVTSGSYLNGRQIQQGPYRNKESQQWKFQLLDIPYADIPMNTRDCNTKYPIVLIQGSSAKDGTLGFQYFGRIPDYLRSHGAIVECGDEKTWTQNKEIAVQIKYKIEMILSTYNAQKVNIIAHSKGAVDVRKMFKMFPYMNTKVASFTSIASPNRGTILAEMAVNSYIPNWAKPYIPDIKNVIGLILFGDDLYDSLVSASQLSPGTMDGFNNSFKDLDKGITDVYCQSYGAAIKGNVLDILLQSTNSAMLLGKKVDNDGVVDIHSSSYANFIKIENGAQWCGGVTHFGIVDRGISIFPGFTPGFDAPEFYRNIVKELKLKKY